MSDAADPREEPYSRLLAAWDQALAEGVLPPALSGSDTPPERGSDLDRDLACIRMLRQRWPGQGPAAQGPAPASRLGRFEIRGELGRGGFGVVFLAYDPRLGRDVALKLPLADSLLTPELRERFQREARAAAGLDHPNLVPVYEAGEVGPVCYIAAAYCPGVTLAAWLKARTEPVPCRDAAALVATLADAVAHAHGRGVLHRDLKPANILLQKEPGVRSQESEGRKERPGSSSDSWLLTSGFAPKITDFGLAKVREE